MSRPQMPLSPFSSTRQRVTALSIIATALITVACSRSNAPQQPAAIPPMPVTAVEMQPTNLPNLIEVMAQTEGAKETEVRARVGGILLKRLYVEGTAIKAGQPLFQIDPAPYQNALAEATARAEQTAREEARLKGLLAKQAISQKEYDDAASANAIAQATLQTAKLNLSWTTVTAPVAGTSGRANKSEGNLITTADATALTSIYQSNPIWARFGLSESDTAALPGGQLKADEIRTVELPGLGWYRMVGQLGEDGETLVTGVSRTPAWEAMMRETAVVSGLTLLALVVTALRARATLHSRGAAS